MVLPLTQLITSIFEYSFTIFCLNHSSVGGHLTDTLFFFFYKNVVFPVQAEYSYFSADFRLKIFLYYS